MPRASPCHWRPYRNPTRTCHSPIFCHLMPWWHESQWHCILDYHFQETNVSNCLIHPMSRHKHLPHVFATSAPYLHPGRILCYHDSLPSHGPFSSWIWNSSELCQSSRSTFQKLNATIMLWKSESEQLTSHLLPYEHLPHIMVKVLVNDSTKKLNFLPAKNWISQYYSPRMILHQWNLDNDKHCQEYSFGTYVQAHDKPNPSNTNAPRTLDCIYLWNSDNEQGGHDLLHLQMNRMISYMPSHHPDPYYSSNYQDGPPHCQTRWCA